MCFQKKNKKKGGNKRINKVINNKLYKFSQIKNYSDIALKLIEC